MILIGNSNIDCFNRQGLRLSSGDEPVRVHWVGALRIDHFVRSVLIGEKVRTLCAAERGWKFLSIGVHDVFQLCFDHAQGTFDASFESLMRTYDSVFSELAANGKFGWLVFPHPAHESDVPTLTIEDKLSIARRFNEHVARLCARHGIAVIDPRERILGGDGTPHPELLRPDGFHLNHEGALVYLDEIRAVTGQGIAFASPMSAFEPRTENESFCSLLLNTMQLPDDRGLSESGLAARISEFMRARAASKGLTIPIDVSTAVASSGIFDSLDLVEMYTDATEAMQMDFEFDVDLRALDTIGAIAEFLVRKKSEHEPDTAGPVRQDFMTSLRLNFDDPRERAMIIEAERRIGSLTDAMLVELSEQIAVASEGTICYYGLPLLWLALNATHRGDLQTALTLLQHAADSHRGFPLSSSRYAYYKEQWKRPGDNDVWDEPVGPAFSLGGASPDRSEPKTPERIAELIDAAEAAMEMKQWAEAVALLLDVHRSNPENIDALNDLAVSSIVTRNYPAASDFLRKAIAIDPENETAQGNLRYLEQALHEMAASGDIRESEGLCRTILASDPANHLVAFLLGIIIHRAGRYTEAIQAFLQAIDAEPKVPPYYIALGESLKEQGNTDDAIDCFHAVLRLDPANADAFNGLGDALLRKQEFEVAIKAFERAVERDPGYVEAYGNLGAALAKTGDFDRSIDASRTALGLNARYVPAYNNLAFVHVRLKKFQEAVDFYDEALEIDPDDPYLHFHSSIPLLAAGMYERGWEELEWRIRKPDYMTLNPRVLEPGLWNGESLEGKTVLVWSEQGIGDTLHFVRYLPLLRAQARAIVFECQEETRELLEGVAGVDRLVVRSDARIGAYDVHLPLMSLPKYFSTTPGTIPAMVPYIFAPAPAVEKFASRVSAGPLRVGIVWSGGSVFRENAIRSCALAQFERLFAVRDVAFFSLQKGEAESQLADLPAESPVTPLGPLCLNFSDTAGALHHLDLVITVDTSVAHLAGAMGKPVWLLLMHAHDWRWYKAESWYPTMRTFVQPAPGDWRSVFLSVESELRALVAGRTVHSALADTTTIHDRLVTAEYHIEVQQRPQARLILEEILASDPKHIDAMNDLAIVEILDGHVSEAMSILEDVLVLEPFNEIALGNLSLLAQPSLDSEGQERPSTVTAIVSTYNAERLMRGCLTDLVGQTLFAQGRLEIIVVDSCSTENERSIVEEFQQSHPAIRYIRTRERETVYGAWNRGVRAATGVYLTNANTDDRHRPDALETMARVLDEHPEWALVYADGYATAHENETFETHTRSGGFTWLDFNKELLLLTCFVGPQPLWRRSLHDRYGFFDESYSTSGDWEFWLRIAQRETFHRLPEFLGLYLRSDSSVEHSNPERRAREDDRIRAEYLDRYLPDLESVDKTIACVEELRCLHADDAILAGMREMLVDYKSQLLSVQAGAERESAV